MITVHLFYHGSGGAALAFAREMEASGLADAIRAEPGRAKGAERLPPVSGPNRRFFRLRARRAPARLPLAAQKSLDFASLTGASQFSRSEWAPRQGESRRKYLLYFQGFQRSMGVHSPAKTGKGSTSFAPSGYRYYQPLDDPETVLLVDAWADQAALDAHHASPMMAELAALRERFDLHMTAERFVSGDLGADGRFLRA